MLRIIYNKPSGIKGSKFTMFLKIAINFKSLTFITLYMISAQLYAQNEGQSNNSGQFNVDGVFIGDYSRLGGLYLEGNDTNYWQIRRAAIDFEFDFSEMISFELGVAYDDDENEKDYWVRNAYFNFDFSHQLDFRIGKMKQSFGLNKSSSLKNILSLEREGANDILNLDRATGAVLEKVYNDNFFQVSYFRQKLNDGNYINSFLSRYVYEYDHDFYGHLGFSYAFQDYQGANYRVSSDTGIQVLDNFLKTEKVQADDVSYLGIDGVLQIGSFTIMGELISNFVDSPLEGDRHYHGGYLQTSWFLSNHQHRFKKGRIQRLRTNNGRAVEFVTTISILDANSANEGFQTRSFSAGMNYYFNRKLKLMAEYSLLKVRDAIVDSNDGHSLQLRAQYRF